MGQYALKGDFMRKTTKVFTIILILITILSGVATYVFYTKKEEFPHIYFSLLIITVVVAIFTLSNLISSYRLSRQVKRGDLLESRLGLWNTISYRVKKSGEHAFNELPIGIIILSNQEKIVWSNNFAKELFQSQLDDIKLDNIAPEVLKKMKTQTNFDCTIYGRKYNVEYESTYRILYFSDITEISKVRTQYEKRITAFGYINIDNLESILSDFDVQERAEFMYLIVSRLADWASKFGAYVRAYSDSSYLIIMDKSQLQLIMDDNFSILDSFKEIVKGKIYKISLSISIACSDIPINDLSNIAKDRLELALSRGGDQAVVSINDSIRFFGAKTDTAQVEAKVSLRMKSEELQDLMKSSSEVMVVGHKNADADAFGATLAIYKMAKALGKPAYIIFDEKSIDPTVQRIYESIKMEYIDLLEDLISPQMALTRMTKDTLLMVVDLQLNHLLSEPTLVKKATKIGVIDHHRRSDDVIQNLSFYFSSTAASSSVELIVQLYEYMPEEVHLEKLEATWLLLGIIVDTNNFVYRCNEDTFKVAAYLSSKNADMTIVKKFLKEDIKEKVLRNNLIDSLETYQGHIGIAKGSHNQIFDRTQLAKVSDEIISIDGIDAGFTVAKYYDSAKKCVQVGISARSIDKINVQVIMEQFKTGGGHYNNAAAQIATEDVDSVVAQLKTFIDTFIEKEESMKVILIKDVKGYGKKGEIIDVPMGFANHLMRSGQVIAVSDENLKRLDEQKKQAEIEEERHYVEMIELKKLIESHPVRVEVKVGTEGKIFGSVSSKQICDAFFRETGQTLNKQNIKLDKNINSLGTYSVPINLHKQVQAIITVYVVEK